MSTKSSLEKAHDAVRRKHDAFRSWCRDGAEAASVLGKDHYSALDTLDKIPEIDPGGDYFLQKLSVSIPPDRRNDKDRFCSDFLKLFLCAVQDIYGDDYVVGRRRSPVANLVIARVLDCRNLAMFFVSLDIEGNLAIVRLGYAAYDSRVDERGAALAMGQSWRRWLLDRGQLGRLLHSDDVVASYHAGVAHETLIKIKSSTKPDGVVNAIGVAVGLAVFIGFWYAVIKWPSALTEAVGSRLERNKEAFGDPCFYLVVSVLLALACYSPMYALSKMSAARRRLAHIMNEEVASSPSFLLYDAGKPADLLRHASHRIFHERMMQQLDLVAKSLETR
jgi:hypothetical protein